MCLAEKTSSSLYSIQAKVLSASLFPAAPAAYKMYPREVGGFLSTRSSVALVTQCSNTASNTDWFILLFFPLVFFWFVCVLSELCSALKTCAATCDN